MNKTLIALMVAAVGLLGSCKMARFDNFPGEMLTVVPQELQGKYEFKLGLFSSSQKDSVFIRVDQLGWILSTKTKSDNYPLNEKLILSKFDKYYFISQSDGDIGQLWNIYVLELKKGNLLLYPINAEDSRNTPDVLQNYFSARQVLLNHDNIEKLPKVSEGSKASGETVTVISQAQTPQTEPNMVNYYLLDDNQLLNYIEKELKDRKPIEILRIKSKSK